MIASVGSSIFGSGTSSIRTSSLPCHVSAFIPPPSSPALCLRAYPGPGGDNGESQARCMLEELECVDRVMKRPGGTPSYGAPQGTSRRTKSAQAASDSVEDDISGTDSRQWRLPQERSRSQVSGDPTQRAEHGMI